MGESKVTAYLRRCHIGDCPKDSTGSVTLQVVNNGVRDFDPPLPVVVAVCDEHREQFDRPEQAMTDP